jgi:hypothetical protein
MGVCAFGAARRVAAVLLSCSGEVYAPSAASQVFERPNGSQQMLMQKR